MALQDILGFWKCLFVPESMNAQDNEAATQIWSILLDDGEPAKVHCRERYQRLLFSIVNGREALLDQEIVQGLHHIASKLGISITESKLRDIMYRVHSMRSQAMDPEIQDGSRVLLQRFTKSDLNKKKVSELKNIANGRGLSPSGTKKELIERIMASFTSAGISSKHSVTHVLPKGSASLILILDHQLQEFPWEAMTVVGICGGVTRMPSLELLLKNTSQLVTADSSAAVVRNDRVRFLLNPEGDLRSTQTQLSPVLEDGESRFGWQGIVGRIPEPYEMRCVLVCTGGMKFPTDIVCVFVDHIY